MCQVLQQDKHVLQRRLDMSEMTLGQREAELASDITSLREELERHHSRGRDRRRDESEQLTQLANHNHRLVEQLAEVNTHLQFRDLSGRGRQRKGGEREREREWVCVCEAVSRQQECKPTGLI